MNGPPVPCYRTADPPVNRTADPPGTGPPIPLFPKMGLILNPAGPSPRPAPVIVRTVQKDGTPTSPDVGIIFPHMLSTHSPALAITSAA